MLQWLLWLVQLRQHSLLPLLLLVPVPLLLLMLLSLPLLQTRLLLPLRNLPVVKMRKLVVHASYAAYGLQKQTLQSGSWLLYLRQSHQCHQELMLGLIGLKNA